MNATARPLLPLLLLGALCAATAAAAEFRVSRLVQLQHVGPAGARAAGSQRASCSGEALAWPHALALVARSNGTLVRRLLVARPRDLLLDAGASSSATSATATTHARAAEFLNERGAAGLLVVLPDAGLRGDDLARWAAAERALAATELAGAVYFALEGDVPPGALADGVRLTVDARSPVALPDPTLTNLYATVAGKEARGGAQSLPTVAVVAEYDALAGAPGLSACGASSGSAVVALLAVARAYGRVLASAQARPPCHVAFVLAAGAPLNHAGVARWLDALPVDTTLELALVLGPGAAAAAEGAPLYLHVSKPARKDPAAARAYAALEAAALRHGVALGVVHRRVNVAAAAVAWPHEHVALRRALGATLSAAPSREALVPCSAAERAAPNASAVARTVAVVADALAGLAFPAAAAPRAREALLAAAAADGGFAAAWSADVGRAPRAVAYHTAREGPLVQTLRRALGAAAGEAVEDAFAYAAAAAAMEARRPRADEGDEGDDEDEGGKGRGAAATRAAERVRFWSVEEGTTMTASVAAPAAWNACLSLATVAALGALYTALNGAAATAAELALFLRPAGKAKKL
eukprot:m51a1_g8570 putative nicalin precursor (584) ;mRNA; f:192931-194886